jgi:hypothetical protein
MADHTIHVHPGDTIRLELTATIHIEEAAPQWITRLDPPPLTRRQRKRRQSATTPSTSTRATVDHGASGGIGPRSQAINLGITDEFAIEEARRRRTGQEPR